MPQKIKNRDIPAPTQRMLWGIAAGRCEFAGCNKPLWKSSVTQETINISEKAHIYSFSDDGSRGNRGIPKEKIHDLSNLMLVCHECHKTIDSEKDGGRYSAEFLQQMKRRHEERIEIVTAIPDDKKSHIVLYSENIGDQSSPLAFETTAPVLFPRRYPAEHRAIDLGTVGSSFTEKDDIFWDAARLNLETKYHQRIRQRLASGDIAHLSIFARAPQPLLILLGALLSDLSSTDVYQLHREPSDEEDGEGTWRWPDLDEGLDTEFIVEEPTDFSSHPALVLSLSAPITSDRIKAILGDKVSIWNVTIPSPNSDFVKSRRQLSSFRSRIRPLIDRVKTQHGQDTTLHVFPAVPVSVAVELGRIRMPKAHMPWKIYDQVNARGGFVPALTIPNGVKP